MTNEQAVEARWPAVLKLLGPKRKVTALLRDARVAAVQADDITLEFDYAFHAEQVEKPENRLVTEEALQQVYGRPLHARIVVKGATERSTVAAGIKEPEEQHDTLDWADVEAWVKTHDKKLKPYQNSYDGYNIDCPIPTHQLKDQRLSIRPMKDGNVFLKCFGGCNYQDVRAAIAKEIKSPVVQAPTAPQLEAPEQEWAAADAQLDEADEAQFAAEAQLEQERAARQKAEDERDQAHDARQAAEAERKQEHDTRVAAETERDQARDDYEKLQDEKSSLEEQLTSECDEERKKRVAAENTAQRLQTSVDKLSKDKDKFQDKLDKLRKDYKSVNDKLSRRDKKIREIDAERSILEKERDQAHDDRKKLQEDLPVSKSDVISSAWDLLDTQEPKDALIKATRTLDEKLRQALEEELIQHRQAMRGRPIRYQKIDRPFLLDKALEQRYITEEQHWHLGKINEMRNKAEHGLEVSKETWILITFTKPQLRAALSYLEPIIDQLHQRSQHPGS